MDAAAAARLDDDAADGPWALAEGWCWVRLREVGNWTSGGTPKSNEPDYYNGPIAWFRITELNEGRLRTAEKTLTQRGLSGSSAKIIQAPFLMFAMYGASIGKMAISEIDAANESGNCLLFPLRSSRYRLPILGTPKIKAEHHRAGARRGAAKHKPAHSLGMQDIPLAPIAEQRRILARMDALFAEIAEGEAALAAARKGLDTFRRALLKAAVTGELTKDWRQANPVTETGRDLLTCIKAKRIGNGSPKARARRATEANPLDTSNLPELPEGWVWATVRDIADVIGGLTKNPDREKMRDRAPYLRVANVQAGEPRSLRNEGNRCNG